MLPNNSKSEDVAAGFTISRCYGRSVRITGSCVFLVRAIRICAYLFPINWVDDEFFLNVRDAVNRDSKSFRKNYLSTSKNVTENDSYYTFAEPKEYFFVLFSSLRVTTAATSFIRNKPLTVRLYTFGLGRLPLPVIRIIGN